MGQRRSHGVEKLKTVTEIIIKSNQNICNKISVCTLTFVTGFRYELNDQKAALVVGLGF